MKCPKCGSMDLEWVEEWSPCRMTYPIKTTKGKVVADMTKKAMKWEGDIDFQYVRCRKCKTEIDGYERTGMDDEIVRRERRGR
jgi:hypothetical protein